MKKIIYLTTAIASLLFLGSCSKDGLKHSPKFNMISRIDHPALIGSYDFMRLMDESDFQNSKDLPMEIKFFMGMYIDKTLNSSNMGIKLEGNNHVVSATDAEGELEAVYIFAEVVNAKKIKAGLKDIMSGKYEEKDGLNYLQDSRSPGLAVWDSTHIVFGFTENEDFDLKGKIKSLMDNRFVDAPANEPLEAYLDRKDDMNIMIYLDNYYKMIQKMSNGKTVVDEDLLAAYEGAYAVGYGNFDPGKIVFELDAHAEKAKNTKYNIFNEKGISSSFMNYLTNDDLLLFGTASIDYQKFFDLVMDQPDAEEEITRVAQKLNVDVNSFRNFFTGEVSASLIDIQMIPNPYYVDPAQAKADGQDDFFNDYTYGYREPKSIPHPRYMITLGLNDENALKGVLSAIPDVKTVDNYYNLDGIYLALANGKMVFTEEAEFAKIVANGGDLGKFKRETAADKTPLFGYVNTDVNAYPQSLKEAIVEESSETTLKFFEEFESVNFTGSFEKMRFEIIMKNKEENALKVITDHVLKSAVDGGLMEELM